jgi:hypothetical protein
MEKSEHGVLLGTVEQSAPILDLTAEVPEVIRIVRPTAQKRKQELVEPCAGARERGS